MKRREYFDMKSMEGIYLEDSFVLSVEISVTELEQILRFKILAVLTEDHPLFTAPKKGEQYCYVNSSLVFPNLTKFFCSEFLPIKSTDSNGDVDFGNIDSLYEERGEYHLSGTWGNMRICSDGPEFLITAHN